MAPPKRHGVLRFWGLGFRAEILRGPRYLVPLESWYYRILRSSLLLSPKPSKVMQDLLRIVPYWFLVGNKGVIIRIL